MKKIILTSIFASAAIFAGAVDYVIPGGTTAWTSSALGTNPATTYDDTLEANIKVDLTGTTPGTGITINVDGTVKAKEINFYDNTGMYVSTTTQIRLNLGNKAYIDTNGGDINNALYKDPADGSTKIQGVYTVRTYVNYALDNANFTNATNFYTGGLYLNTANSHYLLNNAAQTVNVVDLFELAGNSGNSGSSVTIKAGTLNAQQLVISENGSSWKGSYDAVTNPTSGVFNGTVNIEGGRLNTSLLAVGNGLYNLVAGQKIKLDSYFNFNGGTMSSKGDNLTLVVTDHTKTLQGAKLPDKTNGQTFDLQNAGQAYFTFGGGVDENGKSVNVFEIGGNRTVNFDVITNSVDGVNVTNLGTILVQNKTGEDGGFTVYNSKNGNTGAFNMGAKGTLSGVITFDGVAATETATAGGVNYIHKNKDMIYTGTLNYNTIGTFTVSAANSSFNVVNMKAGTLAVGTAGAGTTINELNILNSAASLNITGDGTNNSLIVKNLTFKGDSDFSLPSTAVTSNALKITDRLTIISTKDVTPNPSYGTGFGLTYSLDSIDMKNLFHSSKEIFIGSKVRLRGDKTTQTAEDPFYELRADQTLMGSGCMQSYGGSVTWGEDQHNTVFLYSGTVKPCADDGVSAAMFNLWGSFLLNNATLDLDIFGLQEGQYDRIRSQYQNSLGSIENYNTSGGLGTLIFDVSSLNEVGELNISDILLFSNSKTALSNFEVKFRIGEDLYTLAQAQEKGFDVNFTTGAISFGAVPEPSTVAAVLGACALAFVAYRRRK